jgi:glutathione S-transferase
MSSVLRIDDSLVAAPNLQAYVERCTARPAFQRALESQLADFRRHEAA